MSPLLSNHTTPPAGGLRHGSDILIVDDHETHRVALAGAVEAAFSDLSVTPSLRYAASLSDAMKAIAERSPTAVFLDLRLPDSAGLRTLQAVAAAVPSARIAIASGYDEAARMRAARRAGATAFISKALTVKEMHEAVAAFLRNGSWFPLELMSAGLPDIPARRAEVLRCLARGLSHKHTARELQISEDTVKEHTERLYDTLAIEPRNVVNLLAKAREHGFID